MADIKQREFLTKYLQKKGVLRLSDKSAKIWCVYFTRLLRSKHFVISIKRFYNTNQRVVCQVVITPRSYCSDFAYLRVCSRENTYVSCSYNDFYLKIIRSYEGEGGSLRFKIYFIGDSFQILILFSNTSLQNKIQWIKF